MRASPLLVGTCAKSVAIASLTILTIWFAAQAWDTSFICAYAPLFTLLCWLAATHLSVSFPKLSAAGYALAGMQLLAGA